MIRPLLRATAPSTDGWLWLAVAALVGLSLTMVYSASLPEGPRPGLTTEAWRQTA